MVANFLRWIPEQEHIKRRLALDAALFSRPFSQDDLAAFTYLQEDERVALYRWLIRLPFVRSNPEDGRHRYHDLAQEMFRRDLYQRSQKEYYMTRCALAIYYRQLLEQTQGEGTKKTNPSAEWLELALALAYQLFLLPDEASHIDGIEHILNVYKQTSTEQDKEIVRVLRELTQEQLNNLVNADSRQVAELLLQYIEVDLKDPLFLTITNDLLEKVAHKPSFSLELRARIYVNRGKTYRNLQQYQRSIETFNRALELNPTSVQAYAQRGQAYRLLKEYQRAIQDFDRAIELDPEYAWAYGSRGQAYSSLKEYQRAIQDFDRALELDPASAWMHIGRGEAYSSLKEYQRAIQDYDRVIELDPEPAYAYYNQGLAHVGLKEYQHAIRDYDRAIELNPTSAVYYADRGDVYRNNFKEYQRAIQDHDRAIEIDPNYARAYGNRGLTYLWLGEVKQAQSDYARSWELDSTTINYGWMAEWSRMCQGRADSRVVERLEAIAAVDSQDYVAYVCRGVALWICEHFHEALVELDLAIPLKSEEWDAYFWKGLVRASLGRDEEAYAALEQALAVNLPPVLLSPLRYLEQDKPDFYKKYALPLLARYGL